MALVAAVAASSAVGVVPVVKTVLGASDTLVYTPGQIQTLILENDTATAATALIDGDGATAFVPGGTGAAIDLSAGFSIAIPAGATRVVTLKNIQRFLAGVVTISGAPGVSAYVIS